MDATTCEQVCVREGEKPFLTNHRSKSGFFGSREETVGKQGGLDNRQSRLNGPDETSFLVAALQETR